MRILAVTNIYPTISRPANGVFIAEQVKGLREIGLDVDVQFVDRKTRGMLAYYSMIGPIKRAIRNFSPHVMHVMYGGVMADRITREVNNVPKVVTFHGSDLLGENLSGILRKFISHYGIFCSRRAAKRADGVVVVSRKLKEYLPSGLDGQKIRVIPCGIDLQRFQTLDKHDCQRQLDWEKRTFHVLFPSHRTNSVKRPTLAVAAIERLRTSGITAELHFLEGVPNSEVPVWMNASDALILTSAHEGSPTAVKEALACGLPVISVDVGDVAERLEGVVGCHLAAPDPEDLSSKLRLVYERHRRIFARERVQELSLERTAKELAEYYEELLKRFDVRRA
jgi:teichuronic acid biosynthesis glycosyltransferase TuaC